MEQLYEIRFKPPFFKVGQIHSSRRKFRLERKAIGSRTMTLIEVLQTIPDHRLGAGQCYPLWVFLLLIILATMSGYRGYRSLSRFRQRHQEQLSEHFGWRRAQLPSYVTMRWLLNTIDFNAVANRQTTRTASVFILPDLKDNWVGAQQGVEVTRAGSDGEPYF